ncbi:HSF-type DNA-binding protein [Nitzschia inconspicua]|uniref:HSF-type DNA-binding protein n=1 Tax=Nitzschia inconspicua TaxID=303405 RepID=A0A9K3Q8F5_9STRA|nr:HSF-type DNA-binding protein [Nitzschia inconspicua]
MNGDSREIELFFQQDLFVFRRKSLSPVNSSQDDVDEEWTSTLQFLESDDEFFGDNVDRRKIEMSTVSSHPKSPIKANDSLMDASVRIYSSADHSDVFNNDQMKEIQLMDESTSSRLTPAIEVLCADYLLGSSSDRNGNLSLSKMVQSFPDSLKKPLSSSTSPSPLPSIAMDSLVSKSQPVLSSDPSPLSMSAERDIVSMTPVRKKRKPRATSFGFPFRLHEMLNDIHGKEEHTDSCQWMPDGRSFKVFNVQKFSTCTLPLYFGSLKYKSFIRQLNIYNFVRCHGAYRHPCFVRGQPKLFWDMRRQKIKGTGKKSSMVS